VWMMVKTFWASPECNILFLLATAVCAVVALTAYGQIKLNAWNKPFYDALSLKDFVEFLYQLLVFAVIAGALLALNVAQAWLREMSKLKLREGLTHDLIDQWLVPRRAFHSPALVKSERTRTSAFMRMLGIWWSSRPILA
jgi:vitamin B12/bleomycin/antimicrobial peptide transport system ATP-binding/permease protein